MKVILASQGFTTDEIEMEVSRIVGKPASEIDIAIINESMYYIDKNRSKRWYIKELSNIEKHIGGRIEFIDFYAHTKEEIEERLMNADLIYIVGGKQHIYSKLFYETDTVDLIKQIAERKVLMGTSAGSIVLGKKIQSKSFWKERYDIDIDTEKYGYKELEIVPFNIIPHYLSEERKNWTKDFFERTLSDNPFTVYAIRDNQAVAYIDGKIEFIGGEPEIFGNKINK